MTALIGMSGGVDSSVAAYLMLQQGYDCHGATMRLYTGQDGCPKSDTEISDAKAVADRLGIPFHVLDLSDTFEEKVMASFLACYEAGLTPNPCITCNSHLKFGAFLEEAAALGCDTVVTGHYARIRFDKASGRYQLCKAVDVAKDQSYFLYRLTQNQLSHTRFPLGALTKDQAREIAEAQGFLNAKKRDSQDICFVPDGNYVAFLERYGQKKYAPGNYLNTDGQIIGRHKGAVAYTLGQRKGLGIALGQPAYVCGKDMAANTVTLGPESELFHTTLLADDWNWISWAGISQPTHVMAKARSRMSEQPATVYPEENGCLKVVFDQPQRALTPGQAVVLYQGDTVLGGGTIQTVVT